MKKHHDGFTLIELMAVVAIIGVLMTPILVSSTIEWTLSGNGCAETGRSINCSN